MARSFIESNGLAIARLERIEQDLRTWAAKSVEISFNPKGTPLFSMMELYYSYPRRCVDFGDAVRSLIAASRIVPATVGSRAHRNRGYGVPLSSRFGEMLSVKENYDLLCEVSHPNGIGTQFLYPDESNETEDRETLRARLRSLSLMSIWQCDHLLVALEKAADLPERYRAAFGTKR